MKKAFLVLIFLVVSSLVFVGVKFISEIDTSIYIEAFGYKLTISSFAFLILSLTFIVTLKMFFILIDWFRDLFLIGELGYTKTLLNKYSKIFLGIAEKNTEKNQKYKYYYYHVCLINIMNSTSSDEKIKHARLLADMNLNKDTNFFAYKTLAIAELELNMLDVALSSAKKALSMRKNDAELSKIISIIESKASEKS